MPCRVYGAAMTAPETPNAPATPPTGVTITLRPNGPMLVQGDVTVIGTDGSEIDRGGRVAFCRCGASATKPFCDRSHMANGFVAP